MSFPVVQAPSNFPKCVMITFIQIQGDSREKSLFGFALSNWCECIVCPFIIHVIYDLRVSNKLFISRKIAFLSAAQSAFDRKKIKAPNPCFKITSCSKTILTPNLQYIYEFKLNTEGTLCSHNFFSVFQRNKNNAVLTKTVREVGNIHS